MKFEDAVLRLRNQPDKKKLVYDCYFDDPIQLAAERFSNSEEWREVFFQLRKFMPSKVLDLGAGRGITSYAFAKSGCEVTALEPDLSALIGSRAAKSLVDLSNIQIQIVSGNGETLPFLDDTFNIVYCRAVLHHIRNLNKLCREVRRVLKPKGIFIATREHVISEKKDLKTFLKSHPLHSLYGGENAYLLHEYTSALTSSGFKIKEILGNYDSIINYAPMTVKEFEKITASALTGKVGAWLARLLASKKIVQYFYGRRISKKCEIPGRHYSFIAVKT